MSSAVTLLIAADTRAADASTVRVCTSRKWYVGATMSSAVTGWATLVGSGAQRAFARTILAATAINTIPCQRAVDRNLRNGLNTATIPMAIMRKAPYQSTDSSQSVISSFTS